MKVTRTIQLQELQGELQALPEAISVAVDEALRLPRVVALAKAFCPVATGALRDSIRLERPDSTCARLLAGGDGVVDYARLVHDGSSRAAGRPFLLQAVLAERLNVGDEMLKRGVGVY